MEKSPLAQEAAQQGAAVLRPAPADEAPQAQRKLSFKEKHALETLPATMKKLENEGASKKELKAGLKKARAA